MNIPRGIYINFLSFFVSLISSWRIFRICERFNWNGSIFYGCISSFRSKTRYSGYLNLSRFFYSEFSSFYAIFSFIRLVCYSEHYFIWFGDIWISWNWIVKNNVTSSIGLKPFSGKLFLVNHFIKSKRCYL